MKEIIMYHGQECPHCEIMRPLADKAGQELEIKIIKKEVWHNEKNAEEMRQKANDIKKSCGGELGVPVFFNSENNEILCGETSFDNLKKWLKK